MLDGKNESNQSSSLSAEEQFNLARRYEKGDGFKKDLKEAAKYYRLAAEQGHVKARSLFSNVALSLAKKLMEKVNALSICVHIHNIYESGTGLEKKEIINCYQKMVDLLKGYKVFATLNNKELIKIWRGACEFLGSCYKEGLIVKEDSKKAVQYYHLAADQEDKSAQFNLGQCYEKGKGVEKNLGEAFKYYQLAAQQGHAESRVNLGRFYEQGISTEKDVAEAFKYYQLAADSRNADGQYHLGRCYQHGIGIKKDAKKAVEFYQCAANQGHAQALNDLGFCYQEGIGISVDWVQAAKHYRQAYAEGNADAGFNLGYFHQHFSIRSVDGYVVQDSDIRRYFQCAASAGHMRAQYRLGLYYESYHCDEKEENLIESAKWYEEAAQQGHAQAKINLEKVYKKIEKLAPFYEESSDPDNQKYAVTWYEFLREKKPDNVNVISKLAFCYEQGIGCEKNIEKAITLYKEAIQKTTSQRDLKKLYDRLEKIADRCQKGSEGITKDEKKAITLYEFLIEKNKNNLDLLVKLGECYEQLGDLDNAVGYYNQAICSGHKGAQQKLKALVAQQMTLEKQKTITQMDEEKRILPSAPTESNAQEPERKEILSAENYFKLAHKYRFGVHPDEKVAKYFYEQAANLGYAKAQLYLGYCYEAGIGTEKNLTQAFAFYQKAALAGNIQAEYRMGVCYERGIGITKDEEKAFYCYQNCVAKGYSEAQMALKKLCERLDTVAAIYQKNEVKEDQQKASRLYYLAAQQGNVNAQYQLGRCYELGLNVEENGEAAMYYYNLAAGSGHKEAEQNLQRCYIKLEYWGDVHKQSDPQKAARFYTLTVQKNKSATAQIKLAKCYEEGLGVEKNIIQAFNLYQLAAKQGDKEGNYHLGRCYQYGLGVKENEELAIRNYELAVKRGCTSAEVNLEQLYQKWEGIADKFRLRGDHESAVQIYQFLAQKDKVNVIFKLGLCYEQGTGIAANLAQAKQLYERAASMGNKFAQNRFKMFEVVQEKASPLKYEYLNVSQAPEKQALSYVPQLSSAPISFVGSDKALDLIERKSGVYVATSSLSAPENLLASVGMYARSGSDRTKDLSSTPPEKSKIYVSSKKELVVI